MIQSTRSSASAGPLNRDRIVAAALDLVEADGLGALSARKLAARLGCEAMSLYNHIKNMTDLNDAIVDALLASVLPAASIDGGLKPAAEAYLGLATRYPNAFVLIATRRWHTPNAIAAATHFMALFEAIGCTQREALRRARILGAYLNGSGLALAAWQKTHASAPVALAAMAGNAEAVGHDLGKGLVKILRILSADPTAAAE